MMCQSSRRKLFAKFLIVLMLTVFMVPFASAKAEAQENTADTVVVVLKVGSQVMKVNGQEILMDVAPYLNRQASRTMFPIRFIARLLGASVETLPKTNEVRIVLDGTEIILKAGSKIVKVNGMAIEMDSAAALKNGRTFVSLRSIAQALGAKVDWNSKTREIIVTIKINQ